MARGELWRDDYPHFYSVTSIITSSSQSIDHIHTHFFHVHILENDICTVLPYQNSCHIAKLDHLPLKGIASSLNPIDIPCTISTRAIFPSYNPVFWILRLESDNQTPLGDFSTP
jgi:hypothetical protein